ncbi:hypothetical protein BU251_03460 [Candidatus Velamenicoccus archaeovorus]|uniref:DNA polymerase Y-family little finger domain-containing protein n=1 Tax=Velamenicoccus archaeovorus TaxID=1930593 RepID=A0A410P3X5_VELA1|nr:hypothetical protein BU251_03460 [Candidatus Velamenicoccus archaeovorus]
MLVANFGRTVGSWLYQALRTDGNPSYRKGATDTAEPLKSIGHSYTLSAEICNRNVVFSWLRMLSEMVARRARKNRCQGKTISLWINSKNESFVRQKTFSIPLLTAGRYSCILGPFLAKRRAFLGLSEPSVSPSPASFLMKPLPCCLNKKEGRPSSWPRIKSTPDMAARPSHRPS